jgi:hypothetical protein
MEGDFDSWNLNNQRNFGSSKHNNPYVDPQNYDDQPYSAHPETAKTHDSEGPSKSSWWYSFLNPFRTVTADKMDNHSLWMKLCHTAYVFGGTFEQAGVLDWLPFFFVPKFLMFLCGWLWRASGEKIEYIYPSEGEAQMPTPTKKPLNWKRMGAGVAIFFIAIVAIPLLIVQAALALALTIAVSPIVVIVDIFRGPDKTEGQHGYTSSITTPARQSFWFNPSTWTTGAVIVLVISSLIQGVNPEVFGLAASSLGVIQGVFVGMAALLLTLAAVKFVLEIIPAIYQRRQHRLWAEERNKDPENIVKEPTDNISLNFTDRKLLSYIEDRIEWMKNHRGITAVVGVFTVLALLFAASVTIAFFTGVPADSFVSLMFDHMSQLLVSLIQAMSQLPGLGFLAGSDAVLLPIAQGLAAAFLIIAPVVLGDSVLRFFYKREALVEPTDIFENLETSDLEDEHVPKKTLGDPQKEKATTYIQAYIQEIKEGSLGSIYTPYGHERVFHKTNTLSVSTVPPAAPSVPENNDYSKIDNY